jgi:hypothetical protein
MERLNDLSSWGGDYYVTPHQELLYFRLTSYQVKPQASCLSQLDYVIKSSFALSYQAPLEPASRLDLTCLLESLLYTALIVRSL